MVYSEVGGRCGNQMFTYAISRKIEMMHNPGICLNFYNVLQAGKYDSSWKNDLFEFNVKQFTIENSNRNLIYKNGNILQIFVFLCFKLICKVPYKTRPIYYKRQERFQFILNIFGIYNMTHGYSVLRKSIFKNQFICGTYEDKRFFDDIKNVLVKELKPLATISDKNHELFNVINNTESVCVSFRRGDFINKDNKSLRDICDLNYYKKAINIIKKIKPDACFIFFSDDLDYIKDNFPKNDNMYFENEGNSVGEKILLMSSCKNFIMSNSTFCWWAQYLSQERKDKIIVSPSRWFNMPGYKHQLIDDDWTLIDC